MRRKAISRRICLIPFSRKEKKKKRGGFISHNCNTYGVHLNLEKGGNYMHHYESSRKMRLFT